MGLNPENVVERAKPVSIGIGHCHKLDELGVASHEGELGVASHEGELGVASHEGELVRFSYLQSLQ